MKIQLTRREKKVRKFIDDSLGFIIVKCNKFVTDNSFEVKDITLNGRKPSAGLDLPVPLCILYTGLEDTVFVDLDVDWVDTQDRVKLESKVDMKLQDLLKLINNLKLLYKVRAANAESIPEVK